MIDAHNHLQDSRLEPYLPQIIQKLHTEGLTHAVVNGTQENDWSAVTALAQKHSWITPSFGLHPWFSNARSSAWFDRLTHRLDSHPKAAIGEIGLDYSIIGYDPADQESVFVSQLNLAAKRNIPVTIHGVRAWTPLWELLHRHRVPPSGFLLHAYSGPDDLVRGLISRGAYFSFNASFLQPIKSRQRDIFKHLPSNRILIETDAPNAAPPTDQNPYPIAGDPSINHPANIITAYNGLANIRETSARQLITQTTQNFARLFPNS